METDFSVVFRALGFAASKHTGQRRKDVEQSPYINHPIALGRILTVEGGVTDVSIIVAAILHDTLEDTNATAQEIESMFGREVLDIVLEVTDDKRLPKDERKRLQVEHAAHASLGARLVKLADKISNLRDLSSCAPAGWSVERRREYFDWAKRVVDRLRGTHSVLEAVFDEAFSARP